MQAEIIAVGDELSSGQRLDTNSQWLSQQLGDLGIRVSRHTTIGDDLKINIDSIGEAATRSQIVVITGGLGPTLDDLTRQAMASAFGLELVTDPASLEHIERLFARRGRPMPESNRVQALFPSGASVIANPHGSAPGIDLSVTRSGNACRLFALPGVPAEMKQMWELSVGPRIHQMIGSNRGKLYFHAVKLFGLGESDVEARVPTLIARDRYPTVGITVSQATITLRIAARASSLHEFQQLIGPTVDEIESQLGPIVFGYGEDELQDALLRTLLQTDSTLACAEIGGAWINQAMQESVGQSSKQEQTGNQANQLANGRDAYVGGLTFTDLSVARRWADGVGLNSSSANGPSKAVDSAHKSQDQAPEMANTFLALADRVRSEFGASIGLAVGPYPTQTEIANRPPGTTFTFHFAISSSIELIGSRSESRDIGGHPDVLNPRVAKTAMDLLRKLLKPL